MHAFLRTPIVSRLRTLSLGPSVGNDAGFIDAFVASSIATLELRDPTSTVSIERLDGAFRFVRGAASRRADNALDGLRALVGDVEVISNQPVLPIVSVR